MVGGEGETEDEMVGWHHRLNGHEFEQAPGVGDGQGGLVYCSPCGHKESDLIEWLNWTDSNRWEWIDCDELNILMMQMTWDMEDNL